MEKRIYVVLFCVVCLSVVLLGFSFSKDSGTNELSFLNEDVKDEYRIVYSTSNEVNTINSGEVIFSIINKSNKSNDYVAKLIEKNNVNYENVFYTVNDGIEYRLSNGEISLGSLNSFGTDGDYGVYKIKVYTKDNDEYNFNIEVNTIELNNLSRVIGTSKDVYTDNENNIRFYGDNPNNYIKYNNKFYRIVGIIDGNVKIISEMVGLGVYKENDKYLSLEDYLGTFNNDSVTVDNVLNYKSWILSGGFWLSDGEGDKIYYGSATNGIGLSTKNVDYYLRYVEVLDKELIVTKGDGTKNSPYEVSYGS